MAAPPPPIPGPLLDFGKILISNLFLVKTISHVADQAEYDSLSSALVNLSQAATCTLDVIREVIASEFERNFRTPGSIMRGNCVASKIMGTYSRMVGAEWMKSCIGEIIQKLVSDHDLLLEVDPLKLASPEKLVENQKHLQQVSQQIFDRLVDDTMIHTMPPEIKAIAGFTAECARQYAADRIVPLIGGFFFLRLVNPALVTPERFGLLANGAVITKNARRNLTLITKLLQNLSNGVPFGSKEQYMTPMNSYIDNNQEKMNAFLTKLANMSAAHVRRNDGAEEADGAAKKTGEFRLELVKSSDLNLLYQMAFNYKHKVLESLQTELIKFQEKSFEKEEEFFQVLDSLGPPASKATTISSSSSSGSLASSSRDNQEIKQIEFLTPPGKTGYLGRRTVNQITKKRSKKYWGVLTKAFLLLFTSPQDAVPTKTMAVIDYTVAPKAGADAEGFCFSLKTSKKSYVMSCATQIENDDWVEVLRKNQEAFQLSIQRQSTRTVRALEMRIQNHLLGLHVPYNFRMYNYIHQPDGRLLLELEVNAFGSTYRVQKTISEITRFYEDLKKAFPRLIFPTLLPFGEPSYLASKGKQEQSPSQIEPDPNLYLFHYHNKESEGAKLLLNFLCAYFEEVRVNMFVSQSELVLDFFELRSTLRAVAASTINHLQFLKHNGLNVHAVGLSKAGRTALHEAAHLGMIHSVRWLLDDGADLNRQDSNGDTPLHLAIRAGRTDVIKLLLEEGCDVTSKNQKCNSPLHEAAALGSPDVCFMVIVKGAAVNDLNLNLKTPLTRAISRGHHSVVEKLLESGSSAHLRDSDGNTPLIVAVAAGNLAICETMLNAGANANQHGEHNATALHIAARFGLVDIIQLLIRKGADVNAVDLRGCTALHVASESGFSSVTDILGPLSNINLAIPSVGQTALHLATLRGHCNVICSLVQHGAQVDIRDNQGYTALNLGVANYVDLSVIRTLLECGADANIPDNRIRSPLYRAALQGNSSLCTLLLQYEAAIESTTEEGISPLLAASFAKRPNATKALIAFGANLFWQDADGNCALHIATIQDHVSLGMILVKSGSPLDMKNKNGQTPLHIAVERNNWLCVRFLIESGCNVNLPNKENLKPIQIAISNQNEEIIKTLAESGADLPEGRYKKAYGHLRAEKRATPFLSRGSSYFIKVVCFVPGMRQRVTRIESSVIENAEFLRTELRQKFDLVPDARLSIMIHTRNSEYELSNEVDVFNLRSQIESITVTVI